MKMIKTNPKKEVDYEIMIVGGGPAGISTWLYLYKLNPDIAKKAILIEKAGYPREKLCGGALGGWTEIALKQLKIDINIPSVYIHTLECRLGEKICQINKKNFFRIVRRHEFDQTLSQVAKKRGLQLHENESFLDFKRNKNYLIIQTNQRSYKVKILIGADGALSQVRRKMKLSEKPILSPGIEIFNPVNSQCDPEFENNKAVLDFSYLREGLQGYVWHFPCIIDNKPTMNHGIIDFNISAKRKKVNIKEIFSRELKQRNIYLKPQLWRGHPIPWFKNKISLSKPNILLVGDAAGIEPAIGGGIHLAFSYGEIAAFCISDAFNSNNFSFHDYNLKIYSNILGRYIERLMKLSNTMYTDANKTLDIACEIFNKK
jgi:flavin-dependent dehydrogenase